MSCCRRGVVYGNHHGLARYRQVSYGRHRRDFGWGNLRRLLLHFGRHLLRLLPLLLDPSKLFVRHRGRCGRTLTVPESIERGIGPKCSKHAKSIMKAVYRDHLIEIQGIGNGPNAYFWILINGKRVAIAYESPLARAKEIVDLKLRGQGPASHLRA